MATRSEEDRLVARIGRRLGVDHEALSRLGPVEREQTLIELRELEAAFKANPLLGYRPHDVQRPFHAAIGLRLRAFFGGNRSHLGNTLVRMADGSAKAMRDIRPGDRVVGADTEGRCRPVDVLEVICNGLAPCERFTFGRGGTTIHVDATPEHRVLARQRNKPVACRRLGDMGPLSAVARGLGFEPEGSREGEEWAMLLGLLLGDGSYHRDTTGKGRVVAFHSEEEDMMALMAAECASLGLRLTNRGPGAKCLVSTTNTPRGWFLDFAADELGLACRAHEKVIPDRVGGWSNEAVGRLLAGLYLTDGWVDADGRTIGIQLTSRRMVEQIAELLAVRFGVYGRALRRRQYDPVNQRDGWTLKVSALASIRRFAAAVPLVGRKRDRLDLAPPPGRYEKDSRYLRLIGREPIGERLVWDLRVNHPDAMFVLANGIVTHNSGKTTAAVLDTLIQTVDRDLVPDHLLPFKRFDAPFYCRVVTQDLSNTMEGVIHQKVREWCPPAQLRGGNFDRAYDKALRVLHFRNGSWWQFNSNDQDLNKLGGAALHRVVYDEEPRRDVRGECIVRLIDFGGDEVFAMTPLIGLSFTFEEIYEPWVRGEIPKEAVHIASVWDNPHLSHEEIAVRLAGFSTEERQAREGGRFVAFEGLVYSEWSPSVHVIPELAKLPEGEVFTGIDPGIRHMCGVLYVLVEPSGRMIVFDEIPSQGETISTICKRMHARKVRWGIEPRWNVIDPASRNKNNQTGRSDAMEFSDGGIVTIPGQNSVSAGIQRIKARLAPTDAELNVGPPMLLVTANCRELIKEFSRYRWSKPKRAESDPRDAPVKADDHLLDALRYVAMSRPLAPPVRKQRNQTAEDRIKRAILASQGLGTLPQHPCGSGIFD